MEFIKDNKVFIRNLIFLAVPIILQELLNSSVNMMDTFMIGRLGENEVTAVGLANQIFFLFNLLIFGISSGSSIFMGQYWGKKDVTSIHKVMGICFTLGTIAAAFFCFSALLIPDILMKLYSKDSIVIELGIEYLRVVAISYFFTAIIVSINASLRVIGKTSLPMCTTFISLITNVILNYIFIFVMNLGVVGAALGTISARTIELLMQILLINFLKVPIITNIKNYFSADKLFIFDCMKITTPVILNEFIWALGTTTYNIAYKFSKTEAQAAVQISSSVQNLFIVVGMGVGAACGIMLSNTLGSGDIKKAISYSRKCLVMSVILSIFMGICLILSSPLIISIFNVNNTVKDYTSKILIVISIGMVFKTFNYTSIVGILRSGGDTTFCLILDFASVWFVGVPFAFLGSMILHLPIYFTVALVYTEEICKFFVSSKRVFSNKWAKSVIG